MKVKYSELVFYLLKHTDPTDGEGSFFDRGRQYTSAVYYQKDEEKNIAEDVIKKINERKVLGKPIATSVESAGEFWLAEDYHQDYYKKNPLRYGYYRKGSGRDDFIKKAWGSGEYDDLLGKSSGNKNKWSNFRKPPDEELKRTLTPLQYNVTQKEGTKAPFKNEYWDNHKEGIYVKKSRKGVRSLFHTK